MPICALALQAGVQGQQMTPLSGLIANGTTLRHLVCEVVMPIWALALQAGGQHKYPDGQHKYPDGQHKYPDGQHKYPDGQHKYPDGQHKYPNGQPNARHQVHEGPARVRSPSLQGWGASCTCECVRVHLCICVCMRLLACSQYQDCWYTHTHTCKPRLYLCTVCTMAMDYKVIPRPWVPSYFSEEMFSFVFILPRHPVVPALPYEHTYIYTTYTNTHTSSVSGLPTNTLTQTQTQIHTHPPYLVFQQTQLHKHKHKHRYTHILRIWPSKKHTHSQ